MFSSIFQQSVFFENESTFLCSQPLKEELLFREIEECRFFFIEKIINLSFGKPFHVTEKGKYFKYNSILIPFDATPLLL